MTIFRELELRLKDEGRIVFASRLTRISSDREPRQDRITHVMKDIKGRFYLGILRSSLSSPDDELKAISEEAAFDEYVEHLSSNGEIFQKMEDAFSEEQLSRIVEM